MRFLFRKLVRPQRDEHKACKPYPGVINGKPWIIKKRDWPKNDEHAVLICRRSADQSVSFSGLCKSPNGGIIQNADQPSTKALTVLPIVTKQAPPNTEMNPYTLLQYKRNDMCSKYRLCNRTLTSTGPRKYLDPVAVFIIKFPTTF